MTREELRMKLRNKINGLRSNRSFSKMSKDATDDEEKLNDDIEEEITTNKKRRKKRKKKKNANVESAIQKLLDNANASPEQIEKVMKAAKHLISQGVQNPSQIERLVTDALQDKDGIVESSEDDEDELPPPLQNY